MDDALGEQVDPIQWRGINYYGRLHRIPLTIAPERGLGVQIEATVFVPKLSPNQIWPSDFPCVLGMHLCFDRLRFAVDPAEENFYIGPIS